MIGKLEPEDRAVCSKGFVFKGESIFSLSFSLSFGRFFAIVFLGSFFLLSHSLFVSTFVSLLSLLFPIFAFFFSSSLRSFSPSFSSSVSFFRTIARFRCYWREWMDIGETVVCERFLYWRDTVSCYGATAWLG